MLNIVPVMGWVVSAVLSMVISVPLWFVWTRLGIGRTYFSFLPVCWQEVPYWDCVGLVITVTILKFVIMPIHLHYAHVTVKKEG